MSSTPGSVPSTARSSASPAQAQAAPTTAGELSTTAYVVLVALIVLLAAALRFYHLDFSSLWSDEGNSWAMLARPLGAIGEAAAADIHPPGYYWLLKLWCSLFGASALAMRSLSALIGALLVLVVAQIGRQIAPAGRAHSWLPLLAALLAAFNPLAIYYSQEARMYILLALEAAGLFWALLALGRPGPGEPHRLPQAVFVLCGSAGLWTHYSFPVILAAAGTAFLVRWLAARQKPSFLKKLGFSPAPTGFSTGDPSQPNCSLRRYLLLNLIIMLTFLPWLPVALPAVINWPKGGVRVGLAEGLALTLRTLLFGPLRHLPAPLWPWLAAGAILPLVGLVGLWGRGAGRGARGEAGADQKPSFLKKLGFSPQEVGDAEQKPSFLEKLGFSPQEVGDAEQKPSFLEKLGFSRWAGVAIGLWLLLPIGLMAALGLFSDAFLKFLLVSAPAWCLLAAAAPLALPWPEAGALLVAAFATAAAATVLPAYYTDPLARDNYQGIAAYLSAAGDLQRDLVLLDAPGQQEVWRYYDPGLPVLALPQQRPADRAQTEERLAAAVQDRRRVHALFWATDEADPQGVVEHWLDAHAFKGMESWQGNVRFVTYALPQAELSCRSAGPARFAGGIALDQICRPEQSAITAAGDVALVQLHWSSAAAPSRRYRVTVQLLDQRSQVVAQHDADPAGGSRPTNAWQPGETVVDNHGLAIPAGTPPGSYQLVAALYAPDTGQRLAMEGGADHVNLGTVTVARPAQPVPAALLPLAQRPQVQLGPVTLLGYTAAKKGFAHAPATPLQPGDTAHYTVYWQAPAVLPAEWPADQSFTLRLGGQAVTLPLAGGGYPTSQWQPGEVVKVEVDIPFDGSAAAAVLAVGQAETALAPLPR